jgi:hypothetical protein
MDIMLGKCQHIQAQTGSIDMAGRFIARQEKRIKQAQGTLQNSFFTIGIYDHSPELVCLFAVLHKK